MDCAVWRAGVWDPESRDDRWTAGWDAHRSSCASCACEEHEALQIRSALGEGPGEETPGTELMDRVWTRLVDQPPEAQSDLMTLEELARWLQVPVDDVYAHLDQLPAFEFAGRVRFRRSAIESWIEERERQWRMQSAAGVVAGGRRS